MQRGLALVFICALTTGCASIVNESTHPMKIEAADSTGVAVEGAECVLVNDRGTLSMRSGETTQVRRSDKDMSITCKHGTIPDAAGRAVSRANGGMAGNILFGGIVGAVIDHGKGTAYTYPTWVRMIFGKSLVFDRSDEKEGQPVLGTDSGGVK